MRTDYIKDRSQADVMAEGEQEDVADVEIEGINLAEIAEHIEVTDEIHALHPPSIPTTRMLSNREEIAELFNLSAVESMVNIGGVQLWVEIQTCLSGGTFAKVSSGQEGQLLGVIKSPKRVQESPSLQALCKLHKPAGTCKCWITLSQTAHRDQVFQSLLKWLSRSASVQKNEHGQSSLAIREAYGMRIRK